MLHYFMLFQRCSTWLVLLQQSKPISLSLCPFHLSCWMCVYTRDIHSYKRKLTARDEQGYIELKKTWQCFHFFRTLVTVTSTCRSAEINVKSCKHKNGYHILINILTCINHSQNNHQNIYCKPLKVSYAQYIVL